MFDTSENNSNTLRLTQTQFKLHKKFSMLLFRNKEAPTHKHKARRKMKNGQWRDKIFYSYLCSKKVQVINVEKIHALLVICAVLSFEIGQNPLKLKALKDEINSYIQITWTSKNTYLLISCVTQWSL